MLLCKPNNNQPIDLNSATILAIDNSTNYLSIAYAQNNENINNINCHHQIYNNNSGEFILEIIHNILTQNKIKHIPKYIALGVGPGGFTGVRLAASVAMGLALSWGIKIIPICSLHSAIEHFRIINYLTNFSGRIIIDARMNEVYTSNFKFNQQEDWVLNTIELESINRLHTANNINTMNKNEIILTNLADISIYGTDKNIHSANPHALGLLSLVFNQPKKYHPINPENIVPNYVRNKVASTIQERNI